MIRIDRYPARAACLGLLLLAATACADPSTPSTSGSRSTVAPPTDASATASPLAAGIWLAALRVEATPDALDADTADLKDVLGGALLVSPTGCFVGLPPDVDASSYLLGIQAPTQPELDALVAESGRNPVFEVQVQMLCAD